MIDGRIMIFQFLVGMILSSIILSVVSTASAFLRMNVKGMSNGFLFSDFNFLLRTPTNLLSPAISSLRGGEGVQSMKSISIFVVISAFCFLLFAFPN